MAVGSAVRVHCHNEWVVVSSEPQQQVSSQCHCVKLTFQWCVDTATTNGWLCHQTSAASLQSMSLCETDILVVRGHCHNEWVVVSSEPQQQVSSQCHCVKLTFQWCVDAATMNGWLCHQNLSSKIFSQCHCVKLT